MNIRIFISLHFLFWTLFSYCQEETGYTTGPENGTLLIIGGNASDDIFLPLFAEHAGGWDKPIVVIPTAGEDASFEKDPEFKTLENTFRQAGFSSVTILHTRDRNVADSDEFTAAIDQAAGLWFTGGRQWRLADSYLHTKTHQAIRDLLDRGGIVAGSSAGATIQGSFLARGDTKKNTIMDGDHTEGLTLISNVAIDQHLLARNRQFDMFEILQQHPRLLGIGLDENTGIVVRQNEFEVVGSSYVAIYDGTRWSAERDTIYSLPAGSRDFYLLGKGQKYNMLQRKVLQQEQEK